MFSKKRQQMMSQLNGRGVDFYLEDDMFELEGFAEKKNDKLIVEVRSAVDHIRRLAGSHLEFGLAEERLYAERVDHSRTFELEINRIYELVENPTPDDFKKLQNRDIRTFFGKPTDTLLWFDEETATWSIAVDKINMCYEGTVRRYSSLETLCQENAGYMKGPWQALLYDSEAEQQGERR